MRASVCGSRIPMTSSCVASTKLVRWRPDSRKSAIVRGARSTTRGATRAEVHLIVPGHRLHQLEEDVGILLHADELPPGIAAAAVGRDGNVRGRVDRLFLPCRLSADEETALVLLQSHGGALNRLAGVAGGAQLGLDVVRQQAVDDGMRLGQPGLVPVAVRAVAEEDLPVHVVRGGIAVAE